MATQGAGGPATQAATAAAAAAQAATVTAEAAVSQMTHNEIVKIVNADIKLPELPKKEDPDGLLYKTWRKTAEETLQNVVMKVIQHKQNWKTTVLPELQKSWELHSNADTDPEDSNLDMLYNNFHLAIKNIVHKSIFSSELLQRIDEINEHEVVPNGVLSLRALDAFFLKQEVLQSKDARQIFEKYHILDLFDTKEYLTKLKTLGKIGQKSSSEIVSKLETEFEKFTDMKSYVDNWVVSHEQLMNGTADDMHFAMDFYDHLELCFNRLRSKGKYTTRSTQQRRHEPVINNFQPRGNGKDKGGGKGAPSPGYKVVDCTRKSFLRTGVCDMGDYCFNKHSPTDTGPTWGRANYDQKQAQRSAKGKGKGAGGAPRMNVAAYPATDQHMHAEPDPAAAVAAAVQYAEVPSMKNSKVCTAFPIVPCTCDSAPTVWQCAVHGPLADKENSNIHVPQNIQDKIDLYDGVEKLNALGKFPVVSVLTSGKVALTQREQFRMGPNKFVKYKGDWKTIVAERCGAGGDFASVHESADPKSLIEGPHFQYDEDLDELCDTDAENGGFHDTIIYGQVHKGEPPVFKPKRKIPKARKKSGRKETHIVSTALSSKKFDAVLSEFHAGREVDEHGETQEVGFRPRKGAIAAMRKARSELADVDSGFSEIPDSSAIADTGATDHNLKDFLVGDTLYNIDPPLAIQTANGLKECNTRIRRYSPALDDFVDGFHLPDAPNLISVPKLVKNDGYHFTMSPTGSSLRSKTGRTIFLRDSEVPMFDLAQYSSSQILPAGFACPAHSKWTHLGSARDCDICKLAKMRESPHFAVDREKAEKVLKEREQYLKKIRYLENVSIDSIGRLTKSFSGHSYATLAIDKSSKKVFVEFKEDNDDAQTLENLKTMFSKNDISRINVLHGDNGSEFEGDFLDFLSKNHIHRSRSTPDTPEENAMVERQVGELKRGVRAFLLEAKHPIGTWVWAARVWVAHRNAELAIAEQLGCSRKHKIQYGQRIFGKVKHPDDTFDPTGKSLIFIGYSDYGIIGIDEHLLWSENRISIERFSTYKMPTETVFPGFPPVFLRNKNLADFDNYEFCDVCKLPKISTSFSCKACISEGKRGRPAKHDHTVGCRFGRCQCDGVDLDHFLNKHTEVNLEDKPIFDFETGATVQPQSPLVPDESPSDDEHFVDQPVVEYVYDFDDQEVVETGGVNETLPGGIDEVDSDSEHLVDQTIEFPPSSSSPAPSPSMEVSHATMPAASAASAPSPFPGPFIPPALAQPSYFPHRGFTFTAEDFEFSKNVSELSPNDSIFRNEFPHMPQMYIHKTISRSDPSYFCSEAVAARQTEWNKILEFNALDIKHPFEKQDLISRGKTVIRPLMLTTIKDFGTSDAKYKGRFAANGAGAERQRRFGPPIDLCTKRLLDFFMFSKGPTRKGVATADLTNGYLHAKCFQEVYLEIPPEYQTEEMKHFDCPCCRILKALYGLPEAGFDFFNYVKEQVVAEGWKPMPDFPSVYYKYSKSGELCLMGVYVDDLYMVGNENDLVTEMGSLSRRLTFGKANFSNNFRFLGINRVEEDGPHGRIYEHMHPYIATLLADYKQTIGINPQQILRKHDIPFGNETSKSNEALLPSELVKRFPQYDPLHFVAALLYLARCSRPDIAFCTNFLGRAVTRWSQLHDRCLRQLFGYLETTADWVLLLPQRNSFDLSTSYILSRSDADHAGELSTSKSTSGYCCFIADVANPGVKFLFDWGSKTQIATAPSTPDAETAAVHRVVCKSLLSAQIFLEELFHSEFPISHEVDNSAAIANVRDGCSNTLRYMKKTQRVSIPFLHGVFSLGNNMISFVPTLENTADIFTKFLNSVQHHAFCKHLGIGRIDSVVTSPMRGSIRVDSASPTNELEPAAAGTSKDPTLYAFLNDYFNKKHRQQTKHLQKDSKQNLMSFLNNYFSSKARSAPAARAHGNR